MHKNYQMWKKKKSKITRLSTFCLEHSWNVTKILVILIIYRELSTSRVGEVDYEKF